MNQESLFPYQRRFAYDLAKLQSVAAGFDFQFRSGHQVEPITQLFWDHDPPGAINGNFHGAMVPVVVSSMSSQHTLHNGRQPSRGSHDMLMWSLMEERWLSTVLLLRVG